ncbi:hypothetical protein [Kitasatospora sp. SUK 42]|nr:hypothetical protein [Kitasatospora sp. SUK 42]
MDVIISGLVVVGRGIIRVLDWGNTVEGFRILSRELRGKSREN